jgi:surface antigen
MVAGVHGHVAWVQHVHTDGSATVAHYNGTGTRTFSTSRVRAPRYLYVGVRPPG